MKKGLPNIFLIYPLKGFTIGIAVFFFVNNELSHLSPKIDALS